MSKGKIRVMGVNWGIEVGDGIRKAVILALSHRKETARLDDLSKSYKVLTTPAIFTVSNGNSM